MQVLKNIHGAILSLTNVRVVRSGRAILDVPSIEVYPNEVLSVVGRNGAGKTTLLQVMALLVAPDQGEVRFRDVVVSARKNPIAERRRMAMVFQEPLLFDSDVFANVACGLRLRGVARKEVNNALKPGCGASGLIISRTGGLGRCPAARRAESVWPGPWSSSPSCSCSTSHSPRSTFTLLRRSSTNSLRS
jgi:ABC-type uncharacterized transport system ATPase subunit